ncbi:uncharacterized protein METZ01_LOCUS175138 [marine metagenome]|uniref:DUF4167 domain-containing protein n=1 Tax=marine metagenome TaxID=408172 RepID=A0A382C8Q2_9ZZZZ
MFQRKTRRFGRRTNGRNNMSRHNLQIRSRPNLFSNEQTRNKFRPPLSAEKLFEKYSSLAKEAMSSGDKTLSENYLQHADHFMRIIEDKNRNRNLSKVNVNVNVTDKLDENRKNLSENSNVNQSEEIKNKD